MPEQRARTPRLGELSYGKPAESVELDVDVVDPLRVAEMTSAERALLVARVLEQHPHLAELVPERLRTVSEVAEGYPLEPEQQRGTPRPPWDGLRIVVENHCNHSILKARRSERERVQSGSTSSSTSQHRRRTSPDAPVPRQA